ncbi:MAG: hypothetical protein EOP67_25510, partial [Sphingomonas sp.]
MINLTPRGLPVRSSLALRVSGTALAAAMLLPGTVFAQATAPNTPTANPTAPAQIDATATTPAPTPEPAEPAPTEATADTDVVITG